MDRNTSPSKGIKNVNILVLDDIAEIRDAVSARLPRYVTGCTVLTAPDGAQGLAILRTTPVDLILTDLSMPVMDGYTLIDLARKEFPGMPIWVISADGSREVPDRLLSLGVKRWIRKPFRMDHLARLIAEELHVGYNTSTGSGRRPETGYPY